MAINEKYFQGGKDAKYLKSGKEIKDATEGLVGEFNRVEKNAYTADGTALNKNATLPIDIMNIVYDFFVEKVMGFSKDTYGKLSDMGKRYVYNQFKNVYAANKKMPEFEALFKAKTKTEYEAAKPFAMSAVASLLNGGLAGGLSNLEDALGVAG